MTKLQTIVTHLSMDAPLAATVDNIIWPEDISFELTPSMALNDYRQLYDMVGRKWHWVNRRHLTDRQLAAIIHNPATEIYVLRRKGAAIGYVELNYKLFPQVEIVFFGLIEDEIGNGFGPLMMKRSMQLIRTRAPKRVIIQTCTLDHPSALKLYQSFGFEAYRRKQVEIIDD
ncbi:MAG: GNAT family N-acetyltransferase [Alphaproteobacteria bacterium]|nr:GNAT family N-acetyltransferase [Alphaproteobacteria bacterium]